LARLHCADNGKNDNEKSAIHKNPRSSEHPNSPTDSNARHI